MTNSEYTNLLHPMIGDSITDFQAANSAGIKSTLVTYSYHINSYLLPPYKYIGHGHVPIEPFLVHH